MGRTAPSEFYIEGLREFQRALARISAELPKSLRDFNVIAAEDIIRIAKEKAHDSPSPRQAIFATKSLRAWKTSGYAGISLGDNRRFAFARGTEWGARQYKQFPAWRGNQWMSWGGGPGYYLHPAIREEGPQVLMKYWESIRWLRDQAFPD